ncbi:MAG: biopolymer transporter ExbD [Verrucomicrobia bacterium]|nr:biopolymer transporter ExbD [Verrucomicrobiota bacterium]
MKKDSKANAFMNEMEDPDICIAAMADILFVLLTFFMAISSLDVMRATMEVSLPEAISAREIKERDGWAYIHVTWQPVERVAETFFEEKKYTEPEQLAPILSRRMNDVGIKSAYIRAQKDCPYVFISRLTKVIAEAGIANLVFGTFDASGAGAKAKAAAKSK